MPVSDIPVTQLSCGDDCGIRDINPMMNLVAFLQTAQDRNGIIDSRLINQHLLKTPFQRRILFDVVAIFIQSRSTNAVQFTPGQSGLQHVPCIHGAFRLTSTNHRVDLVNEKDNLAFLLSQFIQYCFEALFELTAKLCSSNERPHIKCQDLLVLQTLRHFSINDSLRESFNDCSFTNTRFPDQQRVILGAALQDLDSSTNFIITADDGVELTLLGPFSQIDGVFL